MKNQYYTNSKDYLNRWIISYADFVTLLLALFMVLFAVQSQDVKNLKKVQSSISEKMDFKKKIVQTDEKIDELQEKRNLLKIFKTTQVESAIEPKR